MDYNVTLSAGLQSCLSIRNTLSEANVWIKSCIAVIFSKRYIFQSDIHAQAMLYEFVESSVSAVKSILIGYRNVSGPGIVVIFPNVISQTWPHCNDATITKVVLYCLTCLSFWKGYDSGKNWPHPKYTVIIKCTPHCLSHLSFWKIKGLEKITAIPVSLTLQQPVKIIPSPKILQSSNPY